MRTRCYYHKCNNNLEKYVSKVEIYPIFIWYNRNNNFGDDNSRKIGMLR